MAMLVLLIRHGETDANLIGLIQGQVDNPLNETGWRQAMALHTRLGGVPIQAICTSDLARAVDTARAIARGRSIRIAQTPLLRERDYGLWEGIADSEAARLHPEAYARWRDDWEHFAPPGGESSARLRERVADFLDSLKALRHDGPVAVVTHGGTGKLIICAMLGIPGHGRSFSLSNASLSVLEVGDAHGARAKLQVLNDTCHLRAIS
ncbi:MAG: histidine phosphatase family protein [Armatimonadota bacterium]